MSRLSVIIPARNEPYLQRTIDEVFSKSSGDVECVVTLDGYWPSPALKECEGLVIIHRGEAHGMRAAINSAVAASSGEMLMKLDAHCKLSDNYDEVLKAHCEDNMIVIPRRRRLDADNWCENIVNKPPVDYEYLSYPFLKPDEVGLHGNIWTDRINQRREIDFDENMSFQGSCWVMKRSHWNRLGGMSEIGYRRFVQEAQELGLKTQLGGGKIMTCKKAEFFHLHKGKEKGRFYFISKSEMVLGTHYSADYWMNNRWTERKYDLRHLIERFWPLPGWPDNWEEDARKWQMGSDGMMRKVQ